MDPITIAAIIAGGVALTTGIISTAVSADNAKDNRNAQNDLNKTIMEREDNYLQRRKEDAIAAGYSPLAALDGASNYSSVVSAPVIQSADYSGLFGSLGQISSSLMTSRSQDEVVRHNKSTEELEEQRNEISRLSIAEDSKNKLLELNNSLIIAREGNMSREEVERARRNLDKVLHDDTINNQIIMQDKSLQHQKETLKMSLKHDTGMKWLNFATSFIDTIISTAGNVFSSTLR